MLFMACVTNLDGIKKASASLASANISTIFKIIHFSLPVFISRSA